MFITDYSMIPFLLGNLNLKKQTFTNIFSTFLLSTIYSDDFESELTGNYLNKHNKINIE